MPKAYPWSVFGKKDRSWLLKCALHHRDVQSRQKTFGSVYKLRGKDRSSKAQRSGRDRRGRRSHAEGTREEMSKVESGSSRRPPSSRGRQEEGQDSHRKGLSPKASFFSWRRREQTRGLKNES